MRLHGRAACFALLALAFAVPAGAATVVLPRPGQIGFSGQANFGSFTKNGEFGEDFSSGAGIAFRARYRMRYERAIGLSFERHSFDVRNEQPPDSVFAPKRLTLIVTTLDVYQLFGTRTPTVKMLSASLGVAQTTQKLNDDEILISGRGTGDALVLGLGAGLERFFWQSWAMDLSVRYHALLHHEKVNHEVQVYGGLTFYAGY